MTVPCPLCGYDAPTETCPHCGREPAERSLGRKLAGPFTGALDGLMAVPFGLWFLATTRRVKRWLVPPLILTTAVLVISLWWLFSFLNGLMEEHGPGEFDLGDGSGWAWLQERTESWDWMKATWAWLAVATEWVVNTL